MALTVAHDARSQIQTPHASRSMLRRHLAAITWGPAHWIDDWTYQDALGHQWHAWQVPDLATGSTAGKPVSAMSTDYTVTFSDRPDRATLSKEIDAYVASVTPTGGVPPPYVPKVATMKGTWIDTDHTQYKDKNGNVWNITFEGGAYQARPSITSPYEDTLISGAAIEGREAMPPKIDTYVDGLGASLAKGVATGTTRAVWIGLGITAAITVTAAIAFYYVRKRKRSNPRRNPRRRRR